MSTAEDTSNGFVRAAEALGKVHELVTDGKVIMQGVKEVEASSIALAEETRKMAAQLATEIGQAASRVEHAAGDVRSAHSEILTARQEIVAAAGKVEDLNERTQLLEQRVRRSILLAWAVLAILIGQGVMTVMLLVRIGV